MKEILGIFPTGAPPITDSKVSGVDPMVKKSEGDLKKMLGIGGAGNSQQQQLPQQMQQQQQPQQPQQMQYQPQQQNTELSAQLLAVLNKNSTQQQQPESELTDSMKLMNLIGVKPSSSPTQHQQQPQQQAVVRESFSESTLPSSRHQV